MKCSPKSTTLFIYTVFSLKIKDDFYLKEQHMLNHVLSANKQQWSLNQSDTDSMTV